MATTYLILSNRILRELNEVEMTSSNFSSSRGIQTAVKDFINKAVHDIYNEGAELPLLHSSTTQALQAGDGEYTFPSDMRRVDFESFFLKPTELITNGEFTSAITSWTNATTGAVGEGTPAYNSGGNGRLRLNDAAVSQAITTVKNKTYKVQVRVIDSSSGGSSLAVKVGNAAHATTDLNATLTVANYGEGKVLDTTFTASQTATYITVINSDANNLDVDYVRVSRSDIAPKKLASITYDTYLQTNKVSDDVNLSSAYGIPTKVIRKPDYGSFILSPKPNLGEYTVSYDYYATHTDLSAHGDNMGLPDRFSPIIVDRAKYYVYMLRSDPEHAQLADRDYQRKLKLLKTDYGTHSADYMRTDTIAESIATSIGTAS
jgi:hypothetical protein